MFFAESLGHVLTRAQGAQLSQFIRSKLNGRANIDERELRKLTEEFLASHNIQVDADAAIRLLEKNGFVLYRAA